MAAVIAAGLSLCVAHNAPAQADAIGVIGAADPVGPVAGPNVGNPVRAVPPFDVVSAVGSTIRLANDRQGLMVTNNVLASVLRGTNEQINCTDCFSGFGSVGSFSAGFHGRKQLTTDLSIVGGAAFAEYRSGGVHVTSAPILAGLFRYDFTELGASRPFAELGGILTPGQRVTSTRVYGAGLGQAFGRGTTTVTSGSVFGRLGWVWRLTPIDEVALAVEASQGWQRFGGYAEGIGLPSNPSPLLAPGATDRMGVVKAGSQWTHLFGTNVETQFNIGVARSFGSRSGLGIAVFTGSNLVGEHTWAEYGARLGYRVTQAFVIDVFANGTLGARPIGSTMHGGIATRYAF